MENLNDLKLAEPERPRIPSILIKATIDSMKESDRESVDHDHEEATEKSGGRSRGSHNHGEKVKPHHRRHTLPPDSVLRRHKHRNRRKHVVFEEEEDLSEDKDSVHRSHADRRMGFLIIGDQHRFAKHGQTGTSDFLYLDAPPVDFSFALLSNVEEIISAQETPSTKRNYKFPEKTEDDRYKTSSVRLSYNLLESIDGLISVLYRILDGGPSGLCWIDLSFNHISQLDDDTLHQIPNLRILYLHGNAIADMAEVMKMKCLQNMHTLTLHGNPIEEYDGYRPCVLHYLPQLKHLDFIAVTKGDKANAGKFGVIYEPIWIKRHRDLESQAKAIREAQDISYTEEVMREEEDYD